MPSYDEKEVQVYPARQAGRGRGLGRSALRYEAMQLRRRCIGNGRCSRAHPP